MRISIVFAFIVALAVFVASCNTTFAASPSPASTSSAEENLTDIFIDPGRLEVGDSLISPASSLYFLKAFRERLELMFSSNNQVKTQRHLEFSVRRLREVKSLIEGKREDLIEQVLERYKYNLDEVKRLTEDEEQMQVSIGESVARHMYILQTLYYQTSDQNAKRAIRATIQKIMEFNDNFIKEFTDTNLKESLIEKIGKRQIAACQFLEGESKAGDLNQAESAILKEFVAGCQKNIKQNFQKSFEEIQKGQ